jgi:hypothetical protein
MYAQGFAEIKTKEDGRRRHRRHRQLVSVVLALPSYLYSYHVKLVICQSCDAGSSHEGKYCKSYRARGSWGTRQGLQVEDMRALQNKDKIEKRPPSLSPN